MNAEDYFISLFASKSDAIGDDGAIIGDIVYSKDAFFEDVHFARRWMTPEQVGYRAMMVNISDAVAMNARPRYALLAVAMPATFGALQMQELSRGFQRAAEEFDFQIIGGDTISNSKLDITVTIISQTDKPLLRRGLKKGDLLAHTGTLGRAGKELRYLISGARVHKGSRFVNFSLRRGFINDASSSLHGGMDISDGLFSDLEKLSRINRVGYHFFRSVSSQIGCSGEEYEMLVGFAPRHRKKMIRLAKKNHAQLTIIGKAMRGKFRNRCKSHHF